LLKQRATKLKLSQGQFILANSENTQKTTKRSKWSTEKNPTEKKREVSLSTGDDQCPIVGKWLQKLTRLGFNPLNTVSKPHFFALLKLKTFIL